MYNTLSYNSIMQIHWCLYSICTDVSKALYNIMLLPLTHRLTHSAITTMNNSLTHIVTLLKFEYTLNTPARTIPDYHYVTPVHIHMLNQGTSPSKVRVPVTYMEQTLKTKQTNMLQCTLLAQPCSLDDIG